MTTRALLLPLAAAGATALGALAGVPASASAAVYCVNAPACSGTPMPTPQAALTAAQGNGSTDTVRIGPQDTPYVGALTYQSAERVVIRGAGRDATRLDPGSAATTVFLDSQASELRELEVVVRDAGGSSGVTTNGTVEDVLVTHPGGESDLRGVRPFGNATIADSVIALNGGRGIDVSDPEAHVRVGDTAVRTNFVGVSVTSALGATSLALERVSVDTLRTSVSVGGQEANVTAVNALLRTRGDLDEAVQVLRGTFIGDHLTLVGGGGIYGVHSVCASGTGSSTVQLANSVVWGFDVSLRRSGAAGCAANLVARRSYYASAIATGEGTINTTQGNLLGDAPGFVDPVGSGQLPIPNFAPGAGSPLIDAGDPAGTVADDLRGADRPVDGDGAGGARVDIGAYEYQPPSPPVDPPVDPGDPPVDPGDLPVDPGEPPVDPGQPPVDPGQPPVDPGQPPVDPGRPSTGPGTPPTDHGTPPNGSPARDTVAPTLASLRVAARVRLGAGLPRIAARRSAIGFALSEPARATLRFARALPGRRAGRARCAAPTAANRAHGACTRWLPVRGTVTFAAPAGTVHAAFHGRLARRRALAPGRYRVTLEAVDAAGNRSQPRAATLIVLPRRR